MVDKTPNDESSPSSETSSRNTAQQHGTASTGGSASYGGYDYQIAVTIWVGLDLMLAKTVTTALIIEPRSHEDIEAELNTNSEDVSAAVQAQVERFDLVLQAKSRSTKPWSAQAIAKILGGLATDAAQAGPAHRPRPLAMLNGDARKRYVFVTNESLEASLRPHHSDSLLDWPGVDTLPPHSRAGVSAADSGFARSAHRTLLRRDTRDSRGALLSPLNPSRPRPLG